MKILVIVDSIDVNDSSGSKANVALIKNLASCGFDLKVLHYTRKSITINELNCVAIPEKKWNLYYFLSRTERIFTRFSKINLNPYFESWFGFSFTFLNDSNSISAAIKKQLDFNFSPDLVITLSKGASFRPHHALLKVPQLYDKWIAYVHDPYPFHYYPRPYNWIQPGYAQKEKFFRKVSEKAKYSAFPSQLLQEWMGSYFPELLKTGIVIPHQLDRINSEEIALPAYFNKNHFTVLHAGNLMKQRNPSPLIEAYKKLLQKYPESKHHTQLLLLGPATYHSSQLASYVSEIPSIVVQDQNIPFKEVVALQKQVSANVILESKSEISPFLPGKFPHCIDANKPILLLSPYYSESRRLLGDDYPYWAETDDIDKIVNIIEVLYLLWKQNSDNLSLNRSDLEDYLSVNCLNKIILEIKNK